MLLRKLIMLAITSGVAKKLYDNYRRKEMQSPFPTSKRPPERRAGSRTGRGYPT